MAKTKKRADGLIERCRVIDGKTRHFYGRTAKEVQAKLDAALIEASTRRDRGDPFCEVAEAFWRAKEPCIKYGSRRGYRHKVELAKGWFEGQGMREITGTDINRELMHMAAQGYAYKSIAGQKSVLSLIWQYWCAEMHGDANPCTLLKLPQGLPQTKRRAPTEQEIADVKAHPEGFGLCPAIMMYAGLRLGEVMALQKKDLANGAIRVCKAVVWHNNYPELEEPKTDSAYRTVPILKPLQDALGSRLDDLADEDFIFGGKKPMTKSHTKTPGYNTALASATLTTAASAIKPARNRRTVRPCTRQSWSRTSPRTSSGMSSPARWYSAASARRSPRS